MCLSEQPRLAAAKRARLIARLWRHAMIAAQQSKAYGHFNELNSASAASFAGRQYRP
jgi:hypothetical protein